MKMNLLESAERRQEVTLVGGLLFVGLIVARSWVVAPHLAALHAAQQYETAIDSYKDKSETVNSGLRAKRLWLDKLVAKRSLLSDMVFTPAKAEEFLSDLEAFCVEAGCSIGSIRFVGESDQDVSAIVTRTTSLTISGEYSNIIKFIQKLKSRSQRVSIQSLGIATIPADPSRVICRFAMTIYVNLDKESASYDDAQTSQ